MFQRFLNFQDLISKNLLKHFFVLILFHLENFALANNAKLTFNREIF